MADPKLPAGTKDVNIWNHTSNQYPLTGAGRIPVVDNCLGFMFTNIGDTPATVNGMVIFPSATPLTALGDSRSIFAHKNDIYKGDIILTFRAPIGANPLVEIVQLFYSPGFNK